MESNLTGQYFEANHEIPEPQAATLWFTYAQENGIDVARAISLWEDAATPEGGRSRETIAGCGIRIVPPER
ncbi:hypothetical protein [Paraburkholderia pallida]|uniref:Uncharacterized protein n=1 Tax=Paraburkholderia pallida TaxID=2547399 RepID=A0A4P7CNP4_9BURK|nr:hypothetical protein [Paraburkholderia pallida]QBQ97400.1 hypothetical protein E1956_09590 [Paraburkholderia pallida]